MFIIVKKQKKMSDAVYKHHAVMCISILMLHMNLRLVDLNIYLYDVFFNYKMGSKKGYMEMEGFFYYGANIKRPRSIHFTLL